MEKFLKNLSEVKLEELKGKIFELILVVEMLCEVCEKPLGTREKFLRKIQILGREDYQSLLNRAGVHDRAEVDVENGKIYFYDQDFPGMFTQKQAGYILGLTQRGKGSQKQYPPIHRSRTQFKPSFRKGSAET